MDLGTHLVRLGIPRTLRKTAVRTINTLTLPSVSHGTLESYQPSPLFYWLWTAYHATAAARGHVHYNRIITVKPLPFARSQKCLTRGEDTHSNDNIENLRAPFSRVRSTLGLMIHTCIATSRCSHGQTRGASTRIAPSRRSYEHTRYARR